MEIDLYWYRARAVRVVDGDTAIWEMDLGLKVRAEASIRIAGVDTPELFSGTDRERGAQAQQFLDGWVAARNGPRWPFLLHTAQDRKSFDRYIADVFEAATGESAADAIRAAGWSA